jgi:hypothetical protein
LKLAASSLASAGRETYPLAGCLLLRAARCEDGDEDDVVAAEHVERARRRERSPGIGLKKS